MFQFARFTSAAYVFSDRFRCITVVGFSHSEIRGSKAVQRLTAAYRSRPRPSSTPGAKASTVNSYYLDGERLTPTRGVNRVNQIPTPPPKPYGCVDGVTWLVQFSRSTEAHLRGLRRWSLKTEQRSRPTSRPTSPVDVLEKSP